MRIVKMARVASVFLALLAAAAIPNVSLAETLHYWPFENSSGFLVDSVGTADLAGSAQQTQLPQVGPGSTFPDYLSVSFGGFNDDVADFSGGSLRNIGIAPMTGDFTVEAFIHMDADAGEFGDCIVCVLAALNDWPSESWAFLVRYDGAFGTQPRELLLSLYEGNNREALPSGFVLDVGVDYYVAAAVDLAGETVTFWVQDLTHGGPLQSSVRTHSRSALNPISQLTIGNDGTWHPAFAWDGLIDEVRISDAVLREDELLVSNTATDPESFVAWWPLDGNAVDASGNGNDGQIYGPVRCADRFANPSGAMCFDRDLGQYINIGNQVQPSFPFTITAWVKPVDTIGGQEIIRNDYWGTYYYGAKVQILNGRLLARYGDGGYRALWSRRGAFTAEAVMVAGDWQHVAVVFNAHRDVSSN
jgi:hypothetical protein